MRYFLVNIILCALIIAVLRFYDALKWNRAMSLTAFILIVATIIFDSLIVMAGIVAYNPDYISGIMAWVAPIEDLIYAFMLVVIVPSVWDKQRKEKNEQF